MPDEDDTDGHSEAGGERTFTQSELDQIVKTRLAKDRTDRGAAKSTSAQGQVSQIDQLTQTVAQLANLVAPLVTTQAAQQPNRAGAAATGGAPAKVETPTVGGVIDIWNLSIEQLSQLGPQGIRDAHEKILKSHRTNIGAPALPSVLRKKG